LLLQEIHHRVKNNLQAVAAMVNLQATPQEAKDELIGRIAAVTSVHQLMYETDRFGDVDVGKYLEKLLAGLKAAAPRGVMLKWNVVSIILSPDQAMPLGLILNELVLNAFKHGFPAGREGEVVVTFFGGEGQARLNVKDTGIGKMENEAAGMGSRLITGFVRQLKGAMTSGGDGGHSVEVRFPISLE
jgi:two-component sensor histidine kinase